MDLIKKKVSKRHHLLFRHSNFLTMVRMSMKKSLTPLEVGKGVRWVANRLRVRRERRTPGNLKTEARTGLSFAIFATENNIN